MYVCICNGLTDMDIQRAAVDHGAQRPAEVFAANRCTAQCGTCVRTVCSMIGMCLGAPKPARVAIQREVLTRVA